MPLPLAALVALSLGALFALGQRDATPGASGARPLGIVLAFTAFLWLPATGYFAAFHGDWDYLYLVPWRRVPSAVDLAGVLACAALVPLSYRLALGLARRRTAGIALVAGPALLAVALGVLLERRLGTHATFVQFTLDAGTRPIAATGLGRAVLVAVITTTAATLWTLRLLRVRPQP